MPYERKGKCVYLKTTGKKIGCSKSIRMSKKYLKKLHMVENYKLPSFEEFFLLDEDPDFSEIDVDGRNISFKWDDRTAYTFGFIDLNFEYKGVKPFENIHEKYQGLFVFEKGSNHTDIFRYFLNSINNGIVKIPSSGGYITIDLSSKYYDDKMYYGDFTCRLSSEIISNRKSGFNPSGRMWMDTKIADMKESVFLISFWNYRNDNKVTKNHLKQIFNEAKQRYPLLHGDQIIVEFLGDKYSDHVQTYNEFMKDDYRGKIDFRENEKTKIFGAHGNPINPDFGAAAQGNKAKERGYETVAAMNARREGD